MVDVEILQKIFDAKVLAFSKFIKPLNDAFEKYNLTTTNRKAAFVAEVGYESYLFTKLTENLNYSGPRLIAVFPHLFNRYNVNAYAGNPEKIANKIYENKLGNGPEETGDGYKYRGRGLIQITGKYNYELIARHLNMTIDDLFDYIVTPEGATFSSGVYWEINNINIECDKDNIEDITRKINAECLGLKTRSLYYERAKQLL